MKPELDWITKTIYDPGIFWTMVTAVATVLLVIGTFLLVWVGIVPLIRNRKAELAERLRQDLLTPAAQDILFLLTHNFVVFVSDPNRTGMAGASFFEIVPIPGIFQQRLREMIGEQRIVMTFEIEDRILTPLQEVAFYEDDGEIDFGDAFRLFGNYFLICFGNEAIKQYLVWLRRHRINAFLKAEALYEKMREYDAAHSGDA